MLSLRPNQQQGIHQLEASHVESLVFKALGYHPTRPVSPNPISGAALAAAAAAEGGTGSRALSAAGAAGGEGGEGSGSGHEVRQERPLPALSVL